MNVRGTKNALLISLLLVALPRVAAADPVPDDVEQKIHGATPEDLAAQPRLEPAFTLPSEDGATPPPLAPRVQPMPLETTRMRNRGLFYAGIGAGAAGLLTTIVAASIHVSSNSGCGHLSPAGEYFYGGVCALASAGNSFAQIGKDIALGTGIAMMTGGVAMAIAGGWQVPIVPARRVEGSALPLQPPRVAVVAGPTSGSLRVSF